MRYVGRITDWNDEKGFGFVTPNGGGDRAFVHIKAFERVAKRPATGDLIAYEVRKDGRGRFNATSVRPAARTARRRTAPGKPWPGKLAGTAFVAALAVGCLLGRIPAVVPLAYGVMSAVAIILYARDKSAARDGRWRTPESHLHTIGLFGGWPGAMFAQELFRHKSRKAAFQYVFWATVAVNCTVLAWLLAGDKAAVINDLIFG